MNNERQTTPAGISAGAQESEFLMIAHHDTRMGASFDLICGLGEIVHASCGASSITHTRIGLDAIQAVYELSDDDRAALSRLIVQHRALYKSYQTVRQVADTFKVKPQIIKGLARWGALHGMKRHGKWVFSEREVERFIETHTYQAGVLMIASAEWQVRPSAGTAHNETR